MTIRALTSHAATRALLRAGALSWSQASRVPRASRRRLRWSPTICRGGVSSGSTAICSVRMASDTSTLPWGLGSPRGKANTMITVTMRPVATSVAMLAVETSSGSSPGSPRRSGAGRRVLKDPVRQGGLAQRRTYASFGKARTVAVKASDRHGTFGCTNWSTRRLKRSRWAC